MHRRHVLNLWKNYYEYNDGIDQIKIDLKRYGNEETVRRMNAPEYLTEHLGRIILKRVGTSSKRIKGHDLITTDGQVIEVKAPASAGPLSFSPNCNFNRLLIVQLPRNRDGTIVAYLCPCINKLETIVVNKNTRSHKKWPMRSFCETFKDQCNQKRRPRVTLQNILDHFGSNAKKIYEGSFETLMAEDTS